MQLPLDNYADIGSYLRDSRESLGVSREDVAYVLNIRDKFLAAIEEGRFKDLPGSIYTKGYIVSYAGYLGLDKEAVGRAYEKLAGKRKEKFFLLEPTRRENRPDKQILFLSLLLIAVIYTGWNTFMVIPKEFDSEIRDLPKMTPNIVKEAKPQIRPPKVVAYAPGCLNPNWTQLYPPCQYYVQPRGVRLNLYKQQFQSPVFRRE